MPSTEIGHGGERKTSYDLCSQGLEVVMGRHMSSLFSVFINLNASAAFFKIIGIIQVPCK